MEWKIPVNYKGRRYWLKAVLEYQSNQVLRIRVQGRKSSVLLENNYPLLKKTNAKKGIQWKIREGSFGTTEQDTAKLLIDIFSALEEYIKMDLK
jgi:hypothetical protein